MDMLSINVNEHTEKKGGLTYLSWAWAWAEVLKIDPQATWTPHEFMISDGPDCPANPSPCMVLRDDSAMVKVSVTVKGDTKTCLLPVMDNKNKAIKGPDAFAINTAIMRCLAKAIAMHGLGLYIYAGEDLPEGAEPKRPERTDGLAWERVDELENLAADMLAQFTEGNELPAVRAYYTLPSNEEKLVVWGFLKGPGGGSTPESRLRALIKANQPATEKAA
jgi:hypothetical protein